MFFDWLMDCSNRRARDKFSFFHVEVIRQSLICAIVLFALSGFANTLNALLDIEQHLHL